MIQLIKKKKKKENQLSKCTEILGAIKTPVWLNNSFDFHSHVIHSSERLSFFLKVESTFASPL